jgi:nucleoid-associated protein YgaU
MSAIQEKYQSLIDMANESGISGLNVSEGDGFIKIEGTAPSADVKQRLWDEYGRIDPDYRSGDLVLNVETADGSDMSSSASSGGSTYTVQAGDSLSKIGSHFGVSWHKIFEANRDKLDDPDKIYPGQELTIPAGESSGS